MKKGLFLTASLGIWILFSGLAWIQYPVNPTTFSSFRHLSKPSFEQTRLTKTEKSPISSYLEIKSQTERLLAVSA